MLSTASGAKAVGIAGVAVLMVGGVAGVATPHSPSIARDVMLTAGLGDGAALIVGPMGTVTPNDTFMSSADRLFLEPLGFTGHTEAVSTPFTFHDGIYNWDGTVQAGVTNLVNDVNQQIAAGNVSPTDPLVIVAYSQGTTIASEAEQQLVADGVPAADLHFVLIGNAASADGGFLNAVVPSLPDWLQGTARHVFQAVNAGDILGATTPAGPYATDVYTLAGDGWADWPNNVSADPSATMQAIDGMFTTHLEYFGLTPQQIGDAVLSHVAGSTDYYTISDPIDPLSALLQAAVNVGDIPSWLANSI